MELSEGSDMSTKINPPIIPSHFEPSIIFSGRGDEVKKISPKHQPKNKIIASSNAPIRVKREDEAMKSTNFFIIFIFFLNTNLYFSLYKKPPHTK